MGEQSANLLMVKINELQKENDRLLEKVGELEFSNDFLRNKIATAWQELAYADCQGAKAEEIAMGVYRFLSDENNRSCLASLGSKAIKGATDFAYKWLEQQYKGPIPADAYSAIDVVRAEADRLEKAGGE